MIIIEVNATRIAFYLSESRFD